MKKNILIVYFLIWMTFGLYTFYWFYVVMDFINQKQKSVKFKKDKIIYGLVFYQIIYVFLFTVFYTSVEFDSSGVISSEYFIFFIFLWLIALGFFIATTYLIFILSKNISEIEKMYDIRKKLSPGISVLLFFLYFTSFPYIQNHINKVIEMENSA